MLDSQELERLNTLSQGLEEIYLPLKLDEYNAPLNRKEERDTLHRHFSVGEIYNPQFHYRPIPENMGKPLQQFIREIQPEKNAWENLLYKNAKQMLDTLEAIASHDPAHITATSIATDGLPSRQLVHEAYVEIAQINASPEEETVSAEEAAAVMRDALNKAQLQDWEIIIEGVMSASMSVRSVDKKLKIRQGKKFSPHALKRLLVHEIGTHVFRYANGALQKIHMLRLGLPDYMMTEEGLATYHENKYNLRDLVTAKRYALRVIAAHLSLTHSYFDVFTEIIKHTSFDDAFDIVSRSKRGFQDTSEYGAHIKDKVYFEGFKTVSEYLQANPDHYTLLMGGKVSLSIIPLLQELQESGLFITPSYLPLVLME